MGIAIRLKEVSFKYDGAKENVLENINLTVEYGETVLLSGVSGEGKKHPAFDNKRCYSVR
mgnify:CR=1 FL=1